MEAVKEQPEEWRLRCAGLWMELDVEAVIERAWKAGYAERAKGATRYVWQAWEECKTRIIPHVLAPARPAPETEREPDGWAVRWTTIDGERRWVAEAMRHHAEICAARRRIEGSTDVEIVPVYEAEPIAPLRRAIDVAYSQVVLIRAAVEAYAYPQGTGERADLLNTLREIESGLEPVAVRTAPGAPEEGAGDAE